jgi:hypothetical protein
LLVLDAAEGGRGLLFPSRLRRLSGVGLSFFFGISSKRDSLSITWLVYAGIGLLRAVMSDQSDQFG